MFPCGVCVCVGSMLLSSLFAVDCKSTYGHTDKRTNGHKTKAGELVLLTYARRMEKINISGSDVGFFSRSRLQKQRAVRKTIIINTCGTVYWVYAIQFEFGPRLTTTSASASNRLNEVAIYATCYLPLYYYNTERNTFYLLPTAVCCPLFLQCFVSAFSSACCNW